MSPDRPSDLDRHGREAQEVDAIEEVLRAAEPPLVPSPGFAERVMESVRREAALLPPIPVPWGRLAAGAIACGALIVAGAVALWRSAGGAPPTVDGLAEARAALWLAALTGSCLPAWVARRLVRG